MAAIRAQLRSGGFTETYRIAVDPLGCRWCKTERGEPCLDSCIELPSET